MEPGDRDSGAGAPGAQHARELAEMAYEVAYEVAALPVLRAAVALCARPPDPARGAPVPVDAAAYERLRAAVRELHAAETGALRAVEGPVGGPRPAAPEQGTEPGEQRGAATGGHVLVVDDAEAVRDALVSLLRDEGFAVQEAADGAQALAALRASPDPLVVFLDYLMPHVDGAGVLAEVARDPDLAGRHAIIFSTANARALPMPVVKSLADVAAVVVPKPFVVDDLLAAVAEACRRLGAA
jgi:CheY-like chemotaxis protein